MSLHLLLTHQNRTLTSESTFAMNTPENTFSISLDQVNSAFGISAATLRALAKSHGVTEEAIIIRALSEWAKKEIPDLDLDSPELSEKQIQALLDSASKKDVLKDNAPSLLNLYKATFPDSGN